MIFRRRETRFRAWSVQQSRMGKKIQIEKPEVATGKDEKIPEKFLNDIPPLLSSYFYYISKIGKRERERYGKPFIEYIKILEKSGRFREMGHRDCAQKSAPFNCNHAEHRESFVDSPLPLLPPPSGLECWGKLSDFWDMEIPDRPVGGGGRTSSRKERWSNFPPMKLNTMIERCNIRMEIPIFW